MSFVLLLLLILSFFALKVCSISWAPLWTSARILKFTSNTFRPRAKQAKSKRWRESAEKAIATTPNVWRTSSRSVQKTVICKINLWFFRLSTFYCVFFSLTGSQAYRPAAVNHRVWPLWFRPRSGPVPVPQQPTEIHWDLCAEGTLIHPEE